MLKQETLKKFIELKQEIDLKSKELDKLKQEITDNTEDATDYETDFGIVKVSLRRTAKLKKDADIAEVSMLFPDCVEHKVSASKLSKYDDAEPFIEFELSKAVSVKPLF